MSDFLARYWQTLTRLDADLKDFQHEVSLSDRFADAIRALQDLDQPCQLTEFSRLTLLSQAARRVMGHISSGLAQPTPELAELLKETVRRMQETVLWLEAAGQEPERNDAPLFEEIDHLLSISVAGEEEDILNATSHEWSPAQQCEPENWIRDITVVRNSLVSILPRADSLAERFCTLLMQERPQLQASFDSIDPADQRWRLAQSLTVIVKLLDKPELLNRFLHTMADQLSHFHVEAEDYRAGARILIDVLSESLAEEESDIAAAAWSAVLDVVTQRIEVNSTVFV